MPTRRALAPVVALALLLGGGALGACAPDAATAYSTPRFRADLARVGIDPDRLAARTQRALNYLAYRYDYRGDLRQYFEIDRPFDLQNLLEWAVVNARFDTSHLDDYRAEYELLVAMVKRARGQPTA